MKRSCAYFPLGLRSMAALILILLGTADANAQRDPVPSWNDGPAKQAILKFVKETTDRNSPSYVDSAIASPPSIRTVLFGRNSLCTGRRCSHWTAWASSHHSTPNGGNSNHSSGP